MRHLLTITIATFLFSATVGQINRYGVPLIKNFEVETIGGSEYNWSIVKDKTGVIYFGNDTRGIIRYDGQSWSTIKVPGDPCIRALGISDDGTVYVGGAYEFGYLEPSLNGTMNYISLSGRFENDSAVITSTEENIIKKSQIGEIISVMVTDTAVYFSSYESFFIYYPDSDRIKFVNFRDFGLKQVVKTAIINNRLFIADNIKGILELRNNIPVQLPGGDFFSRKISMVLLPYDEKSIFIGTHTNGTFRYNYESGIVYDQPPVSKDLNDILKGAQLYTSAVCPSGEILLGTLQNGIFVLDRNFKWTGKWDTETSDLPDNTVTAFYTGSDPHSEIWTATAGYVSKIYVNLPYTEITTRTGFEGIINNVTSFNGNIFIATDLGLFKHLIDSKGYLKFEKFGNISNQTFTLLNGRYGNDEFLLVGTNLGLYQITTSGKIIKLDDIISYDDKSRKSVYSVRSMIQSAVNPARFYIGLITKGFLILDYDGHSWKFFSQERTGIEGNVINMVENTNGDLFLMTGNPFGLFIYTKDNPVPVRFTEKDGIPDNVIVNSIARLENEIIAVTTNGIYRYMENSKKWVPGNEIMNNYTINQNCKDLFVDNDGDLWMSVVKDRIVYEWLFCRDTTSYTLYRGIMNVMPGLDKLDLRHFDDKIWMTKSKSLFVIEKEKLKDHHPAPNALLSKIIIGGDSLLMNGTFYKTLENKRRIPWIDNKANPVPEIKYNFNSVSFYWSIPYFIEEDKSLYSFKLEGFDKSWSKWENIHYKDFTNLPFGKYTFRLKGKTLTELETNELTFDFIILKPWYLTTVMILLYAIAFIFMIIGIIKAYTRKLKNENIRLEGIVAERTAVVVKQKEELESSIHYARRIQMALLPSENILAENLKNYFILFKPRDIVSGDFYWMTKKNNRLYIVAADCTGHGVPGAFMSLLGMSFLDEIIDKENAPRADHVLSELRLHVTESLKQSGEDDEAKDGMDMALLVIDFNKSRVEFSGAYNPCFRVRKLSENEQKDYHNDNIELPDGSMSNGLYLLETIFASKMPIGISSKMNENFVFYDWTLEKGVSYYLFSDGYIDQFGGPNGRKFMKKNFKRLILDIQDYPMKRQKEILEEKLIEWMGNSPQIDDILVMGIRTD